MPGLGRYRPERRRRLRSELAVVGVGADDDGRSDRSDAWLVLQSGCELVREVAELAVVLFEQLALLEHGLARRRASRRAKIRGSLVLRPGRQAAISRT